MLSAPVLFRTMILARNSVVENESNPSPDGEKCLDSQLWHACAGGMVRIPPVNSRVFYFPQGQVEHAQGDVDFRGSPPVPPFVLCRVVAVQFKADRETDEVYARIRLLPVANAGEDDGGCDGFADLGESLEMNKPTSFAKTLTQSDANNGGGFSVPRYCAETIFPRLDYTADPPVQTVLAKDVHGEVWKIRHIYRGTPRRHLLTTGWSTFVNQKRLVAGDSIVFLRTADGELYVGIRRAARGELGSAPVSGWNPIAGGCGYGVVAMEIGAGRGENGGFSLGENMKGKRGMVNPESVAEAASLAARGFGFEVVYYPRRGTPEFCVRESSVSSSMGIQWTEGMRFKMAFETEDSSRISWFMGTISGVQVADPIRWPNSPWRLLQVTWDEPDLLQNAKRVSPWLVEVVSSIPNVQMMPFPPHKKLRLPNRSGFPLDTHPLAVISGAGGFRSTLSPLQCLMDDAPSGIQGARHGQFGFSLSNLHLNHSDSPQRKGWGATVSTELFIGNSDVEENVSCSLAIGISPQSAKKTGDRKPTEFILFGQPIFPISDQKSATSPEEASTDVKPERI